jgi:hypothetical protein
MFVNANEVGPTGNGIINERNERNERNRKKKVSGKRTETKQLSGNEQGILRNKQIALTPF